MPINKTRGAVIVALAVIWQGLGTSLVGNLVEPSHSTFLTFSAFLAATIISSIAYICTRKTAAAPVQRLSRKTVFSLNIFTAGAFCLFYISATMVPPAIASVIETGIGPFIVSLIMLKAATGASSSRALVPPLLVVLLALIFVLLQEMQYTLMTGLGILLAVLAGASAVGVLYSSRAAVREGAGALQIASSRFHLAWIASGIIVLLTARDSLAGSDDLFHSILLAVLCITCPILLLQYGITLASPLASALIIAWLPVIVLGVDIFLGAPVSMSQVLVLGAIVCVSVAPALLSKRA